MRGLERMRGTAPCARRSNACSTVLATPPAQPQPLPAVGPAAPWGGRQMMRPQLQCHAAQQHHQQQQQQQLQPSGSAAAGSTTTMASGRRSRPAQSARRSRAVRVDATLVGPDPRWAVQQPAQQLNGNGNGNGVLGGSLLQPAARQKQAAQLQGREVEEAAMWRCIELQKRLPGGVPMPSLRWNAKALEEAYARCGEVTAEYAKTFFLGTRLMAPEQARAVWAVYVWCRRTDELVDGPNASKITPQALDRWEERLEALFDGRPYDVLDAALTDTISKFPLDIQPFRDMIDGMRDDMYKSRYQTYDELYGYCYRVAGTVALMTMPVMGVDPSYKGSVETVYRAALALGTANQLTNILRDVGEDARERNRIYLPLDELQRFGITEQEVLSGLHVPSQGKVDERWRQFMKFQIQRARQLFVEAEEGVNYLDAKARWPVWSALILYRQILDVIEANDYDNFSQRAYVSKTKKLASLPLAFARAMMPSKPPASKAAA